MGLWNEDLPPFALVPRNIRIDKYIYLHNSCRIQSLATRHSPLDSGDMKPSLPNVLEVYRLSEEYQLEPVVPPVGRNSKARGSER